MAAKHSFYRKMGKHSFYRKMEMRGGALRVQRYCVGMAPVENRHARTPTNRGWWAFPWPLLNWAYCDGKIVEVVPKRLRQWSWFGVEAELVPDEHYEERRRELEAWRRDVGRRVMRIDQGWWSGPIYSHLLSSGYVDYGSWERYEDAAGWMRAARRASGRSRWPDPDNYQLWLPSGPGHSRL